MSNPNLYRKKGLIETWREREWKAVIDIIIRRSLLVLLLLVGGYLALSLLFAWMGATPWWGE